MANHISLIKDRLLELLSPTYAESQYGGSPYNLKMAAAKRLLMRMMLRREQDDIKQGSILNGRNIESIQVDRKPNVRSDLCLAVKVETKRTKKAAGPSVSTTFEVVFYEPLNTIKQPTPILQVYSAMRVCLNWNRITNNPHLHWTNGTSQAPFAINTQTQRLGLSLR